MMGVTQYPEEWLYSPLENILISIVGGGTPSKANSDFFQGDIPWMSVKDMNKHVLTDTVDHISEEAIANSSTNVIPAGIPIVATRMSLGKIVVATFDSAINQDLKALFIPSQVNTGYFVYWYRSIAKHIESLGTGTTVKGIRLDDLRNLNFPLIPAAEQREIADRLDKLLAQVQATQARLARIPDVIKQFRQSVLAAAVSGRLSSDWREQHEINESAMQLKKRWLEERKTWFHATQQELLKTGKIKKIKPMPLPVLPDMDTATPESIPEHWIFISVNEFAQCFDNMRIPVKKEARLNNIGLYPYFGANGEVDRVDEFIFDDDLILVTEDETFYGREKPIAYRYTGKCWVNNHAHVLKAMTKEANDYLCYALMYYKVIPWLSGTTGRAKLTQAALNSLPIGLPPYNELVEIVRRVEQLFAYADTIEQQAKAAKERVDKLTQAILAKAFRGELTADWRAANPHLISGDNSAAALLARIQAERATAKPRKRASKPAISPTSSGVPQ
ncbi:restriction endonuclease subunit S [Aeromonas sp. R5-3]|uniref:restriction endonuclease subunit S n=1 Tax=Aeromonas sp. R5-3 TaxID=3138469 RepID=UPI0034A26A52